MLKEYEHTKKKIKTLTYERNILLDNIARMEQGGSSDDNSSDLASDVSMSDDDEVAVKPAKAGGKQRRKRRTKKEMAAAAANHNAHLHPVQDNTTVASAPPKRSKITKVPSKTRRVQPIERDETGHPKLPQQIGVLTVLNLGTIVTDRDTFHNERYIFPVGYTVSRTYPSMKDPANNTVITSTITDGGDGPRFHVVAEDMPDEPIIANSATGAWTVVVRRTNEIRQREHSNSASGPDYYGFKHPTIAKMIQDLPGTKDLDHYVWQNFEEMEPRAAKGVMAAAEKKRGNLEQMGSANRRGPKGRGKNADGSIMDEDDPDADADSFAADNADAASDAGGSSSLAIVDDIMSNDASPTPILDNHLAPPAAAAHHAPHLQNMLNAPNVPSPMDDDTMDDDLKEEEIDELGESD
ncbi:F/Y-rich N-terminus-domain-containing protein [Gongronella butleri]|nr:F/Y-rich N-terminus-domain-containing protein [Gongronella butleri]